MSRIKFFGRDATVTIDAKPHPGYNRVEFYKELARFAEHVADEEENRVGVANGYVYHGMTADITLSWSNEYTKEAQQ